MDGRTFDSYIRTQLAPTLERGDVVILDNLNVHKSPRAAQALAERGAWFLFLPKYSPDPRFRGDKPQSDRNGLRQTQDASAKGQGPNL